MIIPLEFWILIKNQLQDQGRTVSLDKVIKRTKFLDVEFADKIFSITKGIDFRNVDTDFMHHAFMN